MPRLPLLSWVNALPHHRAPDTKKLRRPQWIDGEPASPACFARPADDPEVRPWVPGCCATGRCSGGRAYRARHGRALPYTDKVDFSQRVTSEWISLARVY